MRNLKPRIPGQQSSELAAQLCLDDVQTYLERTGWQRDATTEVCSVWHRPQEEGDSIAEVLLPNSAAFRDFPARMVDLVTAVASREDVYFETTLKRIRSINAHALDRCDQRSPRPIDLYYELAGVVEDVKHGGMTSFDQTCLNTILRVQAALVEMDENA